MTSEIDQQNKPGPDLLSPKLPPDLVDKLREDLPEMTPPLIVKSGFDFTNWLNELYEDSSGKKIVDLIRRAPDADRPPKKDRISPIWKGSGEKESWWRQILNRHTKESREAEEKRDTKAREGFERVKKKIGEGSIYHEINMPLSDPIRYTQTGEGDPRVIYTRQIKSDIAKGGTEGMRYWRDGAKILRLGDKSPDIPSGIADAAIDHSPLSKDTEWFQNTSRTGAETGNVAAQEANSKFYDTYKYWPRHDSDSDFKKWLPIYEKMKGR